MFAACVGLVFALASTDSLPRGVVEGRVVDSRDGRAVADVLVAIGDGATVRTDSAGYFRLEGRGAGERRVLARKIGYYAARGTVQVPEERGVRIEIGLDVGRLCLDACAREPVPTPGHVRVLP